MCQLKATMVTPCGHRYCQPCITECVGRHHKCPVCNHPLQQQNLIKDHQFDELIGAINKENDVAEEKYFDTLINTAARSNDSECLSPATGDVKNFSPVEIVLKKHLKTSLIAHERYYQELRKEFDDRLGRLDKSYQQKKESVFELSASSVDVERELEKLQSDLEVQKNALHQELDRCSQLVAEAYDRHLSSHIPNLSVLPVKVTLNFLNKNILIPDVEIQPHHSIDDIKKALAEKMDLQGDKIIKMGNEVKVLIFSPFSQLSHYEMMEVASDLVERGVTHPDAILLTEGIRPVMQLSMKNGSHVAILGQIQCESDLPKQCFATTFAANNDLCVDYFSCRECKINWICRPCMDVCHKEHSISPYIMGHKPTWACCYCSKKKKCTMTTTG